VRHAVTLATHIRKCVESFSDNWPTYLKAKLPFRLHHSNARLTGCIRRRTLALVLRFSRAKRFIDTMLRVKSGAAHIWIS
jgi:hypothetical protein